jgi:multiple sugar transport system permease protein
MSPAAGRPTQAKAAPTGARRRRARASLREAWLAASGLLLAGAVLSPYLVMVLTAAKPDSELRAMPPRLSPRHWQLGNFVGVLADPGFQAWLRVSLIVAAASTVVVLLTAVPAAYYTARRRFRGRGAFLGLVLGTQMFSPTALVVGLYREFFELDLTNTYAALILTDAAFNLAFAVWILREFFASIPREIEEAAALDGCGGLRSLVRIVLPLSRPGLVTAMIFTFIAAWNEYIVALTLMTDPDKRPLTVGITSYVTAYVQHWNSLFAASTLAIVPVVVLFALIEPYLVGGLTAGGVN